ncbi:MAG: hypothetical protein U0931_23520 [Vulcanimicrobiota bacterium]
MPELIMMVFLAALLAVFLGLSMGALSLLVPALLPRRVETSRLYFRTPSLWMGLAHFLILLLVLSRAGHRPLMGVVGVLWIGFALICLMLGVAAGIEQLGFLLWPEMPRARRNLASALVVGWACVVPYLGQLLGFGLLLTAYGSGLGGWTKKPA